MRLQKHGETSLGLADRAKNFVVRIKVRFVAVIVSVPKYVARPPCIGLMSKFTVTDKEKFHGLAVLIKDRRIAVHWRKRGMIIRNKLARLSVESQTIFKADLSIHYGVRPLKFLVVLARQVGVERVELAVELLKLFVRQVKASSCFLRFGLNLFIAASMPSAKIHSTAGISSSKVLPICAESSGVKGLSTW